MDFPWYRLHPAAVHFPVALLFAGLAAETAVLLRRGPKWSAEAASGLLILGAVSAWAAFGLGHLAEETAPHVPGAWRVLADHEAAAEWTVGLFSALAVWRGWNMWRGRRPGAAASRIFLLLWLAAAGVLARTAHLGGKVVYDHGMGVVVETESAGSEDFLRID